jgi:hypothetical protein
MSVKHQIVIGHSFNTGMSHFKSWTKRMNGKYKKTTPFTIALDGTVYKHFDPKYHSAFFNNSIDKFIIPITLENEGWLTAQGEYFVNWIGDKYERPEEVCEALWRDKFFWAPYSDKQLDSLAKLVKELCDEFNIPKTVIDDNTHKKRIVEFNGICYKSNYSKDFKDLSPAWDYLSFKDRVELNK